MAEHGGFAVDDAAPKPKRRGIDQWCANRCQRRIGICSTAIALGMRRQPVRGIRVTWWQMPGWRDNLATTECFRTQRRKRSARRCAEIRVRRSNQNAFRCRNCSTCTSDRNEFRAGTADDALGLTPIFWTASRMAAKIDDCGDTGEVMKKERGRGHERVSFCGRSESTWQGHSDVVFAAKRPPYTA